MIDLWCYIEGEHDMFCVSVSPEVNIDQVKKQIYELAAKFIVVCGSSGLTLTKVNVSLNEARKMIDTGHYRPTREDRVLNAEEYISNVWEQLPAEHLHVFVRVPRGVGAYTSREILELYRAAESLYQAVWQKDIEKRLLEVDQCKGLKYLPATEVRDLQLGTLGCKTDVILFREEYDFALKELGKFQSIGVGGTVVMGQRCIGTVVRASSLQVALLTYLLRTADSGIARFAV